MGFDNKMYFYEILALLVLIIPIGVVLSASLGAGGSYPYATPLRDRGDGSSSRLLNYTVDVYPQKSSSLLVELEISYYVTSGDKTHGFKQLLPPTSTCYISWLRASDGTDLQTQITRDEDYIEIGWFFNSPIAQGTNRTVHVEFEFANAIIDLLFVNSYSYNLRFIKII